MNFPINNNEESAIESIEHELYDPKAKVKGSNIHRTKSRRDLELPTSWGDDSPVLIRGDEDKHTSFGTKFLLVATMLLFVALAFSFWRVTSLRNVVSANNIDMNADVTPYLEGGEVTPLTLTLHNRNTSSLEGASLTLLYKQGNGSQDEQEKIQEKRDIGTIKSNEYKKQDFSISLYGSEGEKRVLVVKLEYKVAGSNATFNKIINTEVILRTPPISVTIDGPDKLSVGQSGTYVLTVKNNSATTSLPSILSVMLPNSFTLESSSPKPVARSNSWSVSALTPGQAQTISITGSFEGKGGEMGTIQARVGSVGDNASTIGIVYASEVQDVALRASPLTLTMNLLTDNGGTETIKYGDRAVLNLTYNNTSALALEDVTIKLHLSGDAALYGSIDPTTGYYDSVEKTITWTKATLLDLAVLAPNAQGALQVVVPIVARGNNSPILKVTLTGSGAVKSSDDVVTTITKTWGVQGIATLQATTQFTNSSFLNTGPIPPNPNKETTYTVRLALSAQNTLSSARTSFTLPAYVTWRGVTSNQGAVTYDTKTRTVAWDAGRLEQGNISTVEIGLSVRPSQSHVGSSPVITSGIVLDADEEISRVHLRTTLSPITTALKGESWPENPSLVVNK
jgi:hypothetical protein